MSTVWTQMQISLFHVGLIAPFLMYQAYQPNQSLLIAASLTVACTHLYRLWLIQKKRGLTGY